MNEQTLYINYTVIAFIVHLGKIHVQFTRPIYTPLKTYDAVKHHLLEATSKKYSAIVLVEGALNPSYSILSSGRKHALREMALNDLADLMRPVDCLRDVSALSFREHIKRTFPE